MRKPITAAVGALAVMALSIAPAWGQESPTPTEPTEVPDVVAVVVDCEALTATATVTEGDVLAADLVFRLDGQFVEPIAEGVVDIAGGTLLTVAVDESIDGVVATVVIAEECPVPEPAPDPDPTPIPDPTPDPDPTPVPDPDPTPDPTPDPDPVPVPDPVVEPTPDPTTPPDDTPPEDNTDIGVDVEINFECVGNGFSNVLVTVDGEADVLVSIDVDGMAFTHLTNGDAEELAIGPVRAGAQIDVDDGTTALAGATAPACEGDDTPDETTPTTVRGGDDNAKKVSRQGNLPATGSSDSLVPLAIAGLMALVTGAGMLLFRRRQS